MKRVSNAYKQAMNKRIRDHSYMMVSIGVISSEAQSTAVITSESNYLSNNIQLFKSEEVTNQYATFEQNVFKLDGSMIFPPENNEYTQLASGIGFLSEDIGGGVTIEFDKPYDIKGLTINFGEFYPTRFSVSLNGGEAQVFDNDTETFTNEVSYNDALSFTITPISFINGNQKRLRINSMLMGVGLLFQNEDIEVANFSDSASFISEELPQLDFSITCFDRFKKFNVDDSNSFINYLEVGQEILTSMGMELEDGSVEWIQLPITYLSTWSSNSDKVAFTSVDRFAFLTSKYEKGANKLESRTLYDDAISVLRDAGLKPDEYFVDKYLQNITVVNPLPVVSHAECLQLIANAGRCLLKQDADGKITLLANFENIIEPENIEVTAENNAPWSDPASAKGNVEVTYADMTNDFFKLDGSLRFLPTSQNQYLKAGYVSSSISNGNRIFLANNRPTISMGLPASYTFYGVHVEFKNPIAKFVVKAYNNDELIDSYTVTTDVEQTVFNVVYPFYMIDRMDIEIWETYKPYQRAIVTNLAFGNICDYTLSRDDMDYNPIGTVNPKTQSVSIKLFTFEYDDENNVQMVDDDRYLTYNVESTGENITFANQLISDEEHARQVAKWIANYYANNITYEVSYRGEPRIESADYIFLDSEILNNLQVEVEELSLQFKGYLSGTLNLRRAANVIGD